jgi:Fe-S-cluster containining protein
VDCVFLGEDLACTAYEHRPHVCRLYPFELDGGNQKKGALCPLKFEKEKGTGETAKSLQEDLVEHGKLARKWIAAYGNEVPDIRRFGEYF